MTTRLPASIRNRNPGACEPGYATKRFGSICFEKLRWQDDAGKVHLNKIATMPTVIHGGAAQIYLLTTGKWYRNKPIREVVTTWCGGFSAATYQKVLKEYAGVTPDTVLTRELMQDPAFAISLCKAMARQETGYEFPMSDDDWRGAHAMAFGSGLAPAPTPDNDVPFQKPEGRVRETRGAVAKVTAVVTGAGAAVSQAVPGVPEAVTTTVTNVGAWKDTGGTAVSLGKEAWGLASAFPILAGLLVLLVAALFFFRRGEA